MSDDIKEDIKIGGISPGEYVRGIKNGNIDPSFDNAVKAILWAADEIERLRGREPVAWRWKYEDETSWTLAKNKPDHLFYFKDVICEPLYTAIGDLMP